MNRSESYENPSMNIDEVDFLLANADKAEVAAVHIADAAINFGFHPDSPILQAMGAKSMSWQRMQHQETKAELYMGAPIKGEFNLQEAHITMAVPHDSKRLPGNRIAGVVHHSNGTRQIIGLDFDQQHRHLNRLGFSDPRPDYQPTHTYAFSQNVESFKPTEVGASFLTAGIFTEQMMIEADAYSHLSGEVINYGLQGRIGNSLTSSELAHYDMQEQEGFIVLKNSVWQLPPIIPPRLDQ